jgi:hypothetical protein
MLHRDPPAPGLAQESSRRGRRVRMRRRESYRSELSPPELPRGNARCSRLAEAARANDGVVGRGNGIEDPVLGTTTSSSPHPTTSAPRRKGALRFRLPVSRQRLPTSYRCLAQCLHQRCKPYIFNKLEASSWDDLGRYRFQFTLPPPLFNPACCHFLPERWSEMAVLACSSQRSVANPLLNQIPWDAVLLKQRHPTVTKRVRRPDRGSTFPT